MAKNSTSPLTAESIAAELSSLPGWQLSNNCIEHQFEFPDFNTAFAFMTQCAMYSEKLNHHPTWDNTYNKVSVRITTHDVGGLTTKDFLWAQAANKFAALHSSTSKLG